MRASAAAQPEIHAGAQHLPAAAAAGVRFFHDQNVHQSYIHLLHLPLCGIPFVLFCAALDLIPIALGRLLGFIVAIVIIFPVTDGVRQILLPHPVM